ncbi:hypothetical protein [Paenibacillus agricola]|uniref:Flp pilus-assembly TadE/G-like protein n=1 Tax=Paenibacillus agricola TaxID=2716264 RepID=A0ABX0JG36_9BACL|nr:hypothetical protein [Paenibacillus agricola]NHN34883.1 hypothetical protein [Paenibacillus agricola]
MSSVKLMFIIYFCVFVMIFVVDRIRIELVHDAIGDALSQALDAGLIQGTDDASRSLGELQLDMNAAQIAVNEVLKSNLKLDNGLSNDDYKDSQLDVTMVYQNGTPRLEAVFSTHITLYSGTMVGIGEYPIRIPKRTPYLTNYK